MKTLLKKLSLLKLLRSFRFLYCGFLDHLADMICVLMFWRNRLPEAAFRKILAIRIDRIGDLILTTPALRAIKDTYPEAHLAVLARRYTKDLIDGLDFIDEIIVSDDFREGELVKYIRSASFDVSLGFHPDSFVNLLPWRAGIPCRIGYKYCGTSLFLTESFPDDRETRVRHEVHSALEVVAKIGARPKDVSLSIAIDQDAERFCEGFLKENALLGKKFVAIHPGSRQWYIQWDKRRFAEVADRLIREKNVFVVLIGSDDEHGLVSDVARIMKEKSVLAAGLSLKNIISLIRRASLFIGNSTGPMHIAAALKVPVVAIFGNIHPKDSLEEWGPWDTEQVIVHHDMSCKNCHPGDCLTFECMDKISVEDVYGAAVKLLKI